MAGRNKHMKLKMFVGPDGKDIERQVNTWRREFPEFEIIKSETNISYHTIPDLSGSNQLQQRIAMVIWYNDGRSSEVLPLPSPTPPRQLRSSN
jgi:hypothetical protein